MRYNSLFAIACLWTLSACSSTTLIETTYDSSTNEHSTRVYTKYYDAGDWLVPDQLGASVAADHMKRRVPIVYGVQRSMGALGPDDSYARAKITIYLWNFTDSSKEVSDIQLTSGGQSLQIDRKPISAAPRTRTQIDMGVIDVFDSAKNIRVNVIYTVNGERLEQSLNLTRRTRDELRTLFGPNGRLPYPWHARLGELR